MEQVKFEQGQLVYVGEMGEVALTKFFYEKKSDKHWYYLPEGASRKLVAKEAVVGAEGQVLELAARAPKSTSGLKSQWSWLDYLTAEEKAQLEELKARAIARHDDPKEKLRREIAKRQAELAKLMAELNG